MNNRLIQLIQDLILFMNTLNKIVVDIDNLIAKHRQLGTIDQLNN